MDNICIKNFDEFKEIIDKTKFSTEKHKDIVIFTNGNEWYIPTLINNLIESMKIHEPDKEIIVFCSDKKAQDACQKLGFKHFLFLDIPDLQVSDITGNSPAGTSFYTRLTFFKIVITRHLFEMGYTPLYIDPDMAFLKPSIQDLLNYLDKSPMILAGTPGYINSNLMIGRPSQENIRLYQLSVNDLNDVIESKDKGSDEDHLRPLLIRQNVDFLCVSTKEYPPGCYAVKYMKIARMIHSNCVVGLQNKIRLMKGCKAWFLPEEYTPFFGKEFMPPVMINFPPMRKGELIEEFFDKYTRETKPVLKRKYINVGWTNIYCNTQFKGVPFDFYRLQMELNKLPRDGKYFTVCQYAGKIRQVLPPDTVVFGGSEGNYPLPLVYQNKEFFGGVKKKSWDEKKTFCSFVGQHTHPVRDKVKKYMDQFDDYFYFQHPSGSSDFNVDIFVEKTVDSKFCLAPRGFGRSSFRYFEALQFGTVPVYIWDDVLWLPFQDVIDYEKLSVNINIKDLDKLDGILRNISKEKYEEMIKYAEDVLYKFTFEGISKEVINAVNK